MLSLLVWIPVCAAIVFGCLPQSIDAGRLRSIALSIASVIFLLSLSLLWQFDPAQTGMQLKESFDWISALGLNYQLSVDGLSMPLVVLNGLLILIAVASSGEMHRPRLYYALMLLLNGVVSGAFLSTNLLLFFLFYEAELIPLYLLIAIWGGDRRSYAATKFLLYTAVSGFLLLGVFFGTAVMGSGLQSALSFDFEVLKNLALPSATQFPLLIVLLIAFGIKIPLVPFHTWLPDAHVEAPTPVSILLAGVLLKLGAYGLLRFGLGLFPEAWQQIAPWLATWAVVSVLYGCFNAVIQTDMKKMVAYSSVGHMGYILLGMAAATPLSLLGASFQMISHGLISALLFFLVGVVYTKTGTRDLNTLKGLLNPERGLPIIGGLMILGVMASAGIPGMVGFIAEFLVFRGSFPVFPVQTLLCMIGTGLTAVYFLILVDKAFFGRLPSGKAELEQAALERANQGKPALPVIYPRVLWQERIPAIALAAIIVILGLQPSWVTYWIEQSAAMITPTNSQVAISSSFPITINPNSSQIGTQNETTSRPSSS